jgi:hypothetical protein
MIPCILDQIFRRVQTNETEIATLKDMIATKKTVDVNVVSNNLRDEDDEI